MEARGVGSAKRRNSATHEDDGSYTRESRVNMGVTLFKGRLRVPRVAWVCVHQRPQHWNRGRVPLSPFRLCSQTPSRQVGPYERVWRSDALIPDELQDQLISAVSPLEDVPDAEKDWHPRSKNQVLDLVHPSLYPIVYNRTFIQDPQTGKCEVLEPQDDSHEYYISEKFQWLPSDFVVAEDGAVTLASPYINNVHPRKHAALESVIPRLLERAIPLWERVLSDTSRPLLPFRTKSKDEDSLPDCLFADADKNYPDSDESRGPDRYAWLSKRNLKLPDARDKYTGDLDVMRTPTVSLKGTTIQCIIKLADIVLTPEKPKYPGGKWHVEGRRVIASIPFGRNAHLCSSGMKNEHIISSFVYVSPSSNRHLAARY